MCRRTRHPLLRSDRVDWVTPLVIGSLIVGLAGLGVGTYAVATMPAEASGPQGPAGAQGLTGPQGWPGRAGVKGRDRPGRLGGRYVDRCQCSPAIRRRPCDRHRARGETACPAEKVLLSGGAQVSAPGVLADRNVELRSSFPYNKTQWQTVAIVTGRLGAGVEMTMQPYVVCGEGATTGTSTTTTTAVP